MKSIKVMRAVLLSAALWTMVGARATDLVFTGCYFGNLPDLTLTVSGGSNWVCSLERLNRTNQVWESQGQFTLTNGTADVLTSLHEGAYGIFRARTTNNAHLSTNAFGAILQSLPTGKSMVGSPFGPVYATDLFPDPADGMKIYQWDNSTSNYVSSIYDSGEWSVYPYLNQGEGVIVEVPTNAPSVQLLAWGFFGLTNTTYSIPSGYSILCLPRYQLTTPTNWVCDEFVTNRLGGYTSLPVTNAGANPQSTVSRMISSDGTYKDYTLTTTNLWKSGADVTTVPIKVTEAFWFKRTNAVTWTFSTPIWW